MYNCLCSVIVCDDDDDDDERKGETIEGGDEWVEIGEKRGDDVKRETEMYA